MTRRALLASTFFLFLMAKTASSQNIIESEDLVFNLDFESSFEAFGPIETETHYAFIDLQLEKIKLFDKGKRNVVENRSLVTKGPNSTQSPISLFYAESNFYVIDFYKATLNKLNDSGEVVQIYDFQSSLIGRSGYFPSWISRVNGSTDYAYIPIQAGIEFNSGLSDHSINTILNIDLKSGEMKMLLPYPKNYQNHIAAGYTSFVSTTYNKKSGSLVVSFPLEESVYEINKASEITEHQTNSKSSIDISQHFYKDESALKSAFDRKQYSENYLSKSSFWVICYDAFNDVYWRFINQPVTNKYEDLSVSEQVLNRSYRIEILNSEFKSIFLSTPISGIDLSVNTGKAFVTKGGIHVLSNDQNNENLIRFKTFVFQR